MSTTKLTRAQKLAKLDYLQAMRMAGIEARPALNLDMTKMIDKYVIGEYFIKFLSCYYGKSTKIKMEKKLAYKIGEYADKYMMPICIDDIFAILPNMIKAYDNSSLRIDGTLVEIAIATVYCASTTYLYELVKQFNKNND